MDPTSLEKLAETLSLEGTDLNKGKIAQVVQSKAKVQAGHAV